MYIRRTPPFGIDSSFVKYNYSPPIKSNASFLVTSYRTFPLAYLLRPLSLS